MKTNKKLLSRVLAMVLCAVMLLGSTGLAPAFAADGIVDDGIDATLTDDAVQSPGDGVDGTNGNGDDTIVPDGNGDDAAVPDIDADDNAGSDPVPGDNEIIPDPEPDPDLEWQAALEALQAAYDAFVAEIDAERRYHMDQAEHSCLYPDFDAFLARYETAVTTGMDLSSEEAYQALMARFGALLSEAAVSAYLARGEMILVSDYDGMPGFDSDVSRMEGLKRYILDLAAVFDMDERIESARQALAERLENGDVDPEDPDDPESPDDPENPGEPEDPAVPETVTAVLDYYDAFCARLPDMTFDQVLVELDVLAGLISAVAPEDRTEAVVLIEGYIPEIRSQQAMAEFVRRVNAIREQAAAGKYDVNHPDFDRAAAQAEFDAVRALSQYMLDTELASENHANGLKILSNLEELMDAEPEPELSEAAVAFLDSVNRLQEEMQTEYAGRPYSAIKAVDKLLTECSGLSATDLLDENVQAAKIALENMKRRIVIKPEILAFLQNVDILLFSVNNGASLDSEIVTQQAAAVVESMDVLTEADMENVEVAEAYQKLVEAGLVPEDAVNYAVMAISGVVTCDGVPFEGADIAIFKYSDGVYTRVTETKQLVAIDILKTSSDGAYGVNDIWPNDYYVAVRGVHGVQPAADSALIKVTDDMEGLAGWLYVHAVSGTIGSVVCDISFISDVPPVSMMTGVYEQANSSGFVSGQSGFMPYDEIDDEYASAWAEDPSFVGELSNKGDPIATLGVGEKGYIAADIRVTSEFGASNISFSLSDFNGVSADLIPDDPKFGVFGVYELDASGRPIRALNESEYEILALGDYRGNPVICIHDQDLLSYGKAYRIIWSFYSFWHYNGFTTEGSGAAVNGIFCYCVYGDDHHLPDPSIECDYVTDVAEYMQSGVLVDLTDMDGVRLPGAKFKLYYDEACTRQASLIAGDPNATFDNIVCVCEDTTYVPNYTVNPSVRHDDVEVPIDDVIQINGLKSGTYYLKQTVFPDGYEAEDGGSGVTKICVNNDNGALCEQYQYVIKNRIKLPPYEVNITWLDGMAGATLSEDKKHADFALGYNHGIANKLRLEILLNSDVAAGETLLFWPNTLWEYDSSGIVDPAGKPVHCCFAVRNFPSVNGLTCSLNSDMSMRQLRTTGDFPAGTKLVIPVDVEYVFSYYVSSSAWQSMASKTGVLWFDGDGVFEFTDGLSGDHALTFSCSTDVERLDISDHSAQYSPAHNRGARVFTWNPYIKSSYGLSKEDFDQQVAAGNLFFEYGYKVDAQAASFAHIDFSMLPSGSGVVHGVSARVLVNSTTLVDINEPVVSSPLSEFDYRMRVSTGGYRNDNTQFGSYLINSWLCGSQRNSFHHNYAVNGVVLWSLVSYPADEISDLDAGTTSASCTLSARLSLAETDGFIDASHTVVHLEPLNKFTSDGNMYSLNVASANNSDPVNNIISTMLLLDADPSTNLSYPRLAAILTGEYRFADGAEPDTVSLCFDAIGMNRMTQTSPSKATGQYVMLGPDDYAITRVFFSEKIIGIAYFDDEDNFLSGSLDRELYGNDIMRLYVCTNDDPDAWILDQEFRINDIFGGGDIVLRHDDIIRVKVEYPNHRSYARFKILCNVDIKNGPVVSDCADSIRNLPYDVFLAKWGLAFFGALNVTRQDGSALLIKDENHISGTLAKEINQLSQTLYSDIYASDEFPLRSSAFCTIGTNNMLPGVFYRSNSIHTSNDENFYKMYIAGGIDTARFEPSVFSGSVLEGLHDADFYIHIPPQCEISYIVPGNATSIPADKLLSNGEQAMSVYGNAYAFSEILFADSLVPDISYDVVVLDDGSTEICVHTHLEHDRVSRLSALYAANPQYNTKNNAQFFPYGGFTICMTPRYTNDFQGTVRVELGFAVKDGNSYFRGNRVVKTKPDSGFHVNGNTYFDDLDDNGSVTDQFVTAFASHSFQGSSTIQSSGLQLAAQGSDNQFWNKSVTTHTGDPYAYRLTYSQMAETSKNVVLFDSLEDLPGNTWTGHLDSIDLSDAKAKNLSVKVYRNDKNIDSVKYVQDNITGEQLAAGYDGWTLLTECMPDDPNSYSISGDLSAVKSVAFDFGDQEFAKDQAGKPNAVQVYLRMSAPVSGFGNGSNPVQNRAFYSDVLIGSGKARSVMANTVTVDLDTTVAVNVSKTIAPGWADVSEGEDYAGFTITTYFDTVPDTVSSKARYLCHETTVSSNDTDEIQYAPVDSFVNTYYGGEWRVYWICPSNTVFSLEGANIVTRLDISSPGAIGQEAAVMDLDQATLIGTFGYGESITVTDEMRNGGNLVMFARQVVDESEGPGPGPGEGPVGPPEPPVDTDGGEIFIEPLFSTWSMQADTGASGWVTTRDPDTGKLTIDKNGRPEYDLRYHYTMRYAQVRPAADRYEKVHDVVLYDEIEAGSDSRYAGRLDNISITGQTWWENPITPLSVIDDERHDFGYGFVGSVDMPDCCDVFISYPDVVPSVNLPDALVETTGRSDWELFSVGVVPKDLGQKITAVAVYVPEMIAKVETGDDLVQDSFIEVNLNMVHAGKPGNKGVDKILRNGFTVGFMPDGTDARIVDSRPDQTELEIVYRDTSVVLPVTGGSGAVPMYLTGMLFLVPAAIAITCRTRKRQAR